MKRTSLPVATPALVSLALLALLALLPATVPTAAAEKRSDEEILREIKEVKWPLAYAEQDVDLLDSILADEFQMIDAEGAWSDKAGELAWVRDHKPSYRSFTFEIKRLEIFGGDTAVIAGTGRVEGAGEDGATNFTYQSSNVLIKRDGRWQAILSHVSGVKEE